MIKQFIHQNVFKIRRGGGPIPFSIDPGPLEGMILDYPPSLVFYDNMMDQYHITVDSKVFNPINDIIPGEVFAERGWGFVFNFRNSIIAVGDYPKYTLECYIDGVYIGDSIGSGDTPSGLSFSGILDNFPTTSVEFVIIKTDPYICEGDLEMNMNYNGITELPCTNSLTDGMKVRFHFTLEQKSLPTITPGRGDYISDIVTVNSGVVTKVISFKAKTTNIEVAYIALAYNGTDYRCVTSVSTSPNILTTNFNKIVLKRIEVISELSSHAGYIYFNFEDMPAYGDIGYGNWNEVKESLWIGESIGDSPEDSSYIYPILTVTTTDYNVRFEEAIISDDGMTLMYKVNPINGADISGLYVEQICYFDETSPNLSELCYTDSVGGTDLGAAIASKGIAGSIDSSGSHLTFIR